MSIEGQRVKVGKEEIGMDLREDTAFYSEEAWGAFEGFRAGTCGDDLDFKITVAVTTWVQI